MQELVSLRKPAEPGPVLTVNKLIGKIMAIK